MICACEKNVLFMMHATGVHSKCHAHGNHCRTNSGKVQICSVSVCVCGVACVVWHAEPPVCTFKVSPRMRALEHPKLNSSLIAKFLLALNGPRRVITCFRGSPKEIIESDPLKV